MNEWCGRLLDSNFHPCRQNPSEERIIFLVTEKGWLSAVSNNPISHRHISSASLSPTQICPLQSAFISTFWFHNRVYQNFHFSLRRLKLVISWLVPCQCSSINLNTYKQLKNHGALTETNLLAKSWFDNLIAARTNFVNSQHACGQHM
jgi:hypothetical protein